MITKYMKEVVTKYNPFNPAAKSARLFLNQFPANARQSGISIKATVLPRSTTEKNSLSVKFKDGVELNLDCDKMTVKQLTEEADRHSRRLQKAEDLEA